MKIPLICRECKREFFKEKREYDRRVRIGKAEFYCSISCKSKAQIRLTPPKTTATSIERIKKHCANKRDQYTPFRWFVLRAQYRSKKKGWSCNLTTLYLKLLWEDQKGICPFTGWKLILPNNTQKAWENNKAENASLDRIDNSKGYVEGNVRYVSIMANLARQSFSDKEVLDFCKAVTEKCATL